jgi:hypothetical protein
MTNHDYKFARLGNLIASALDGATRDLRDPREVSRLASQAVARLLRAARRASHPVPTIAG